MTNTRVVRPPFISTLGCSLFNDAGYGITCQNRGSGMLSMRLVPRRWQQRSPKPLGDPWRQAQRLFMQMGTRRLPPGSRQRIINENERSGFVCGTVFKAPMFLSRRRQNRGEIAYVPLLLYMIVIRPVNQRDPQGQ